MNAHNTMNKDNYTIQNESLKITTVLSRLDFRITSKNSYYVAYDISDQTVPRLSYNVSA